VGFFKVPPEYPTLVRTTPLVLPNKASGSQKQPIANVAVSVSPGADTSIGGIRFLPVFIDTIIFYSLFFLINQQGFY
jgi:hypothetical protein